MKFTAIENVSRLVICLQLWYFKFHLSLCSQKFFFVHSLVHSHMSTWRWFKFWNIAKLNQGNNRCKNWSENYWKIASLPPVLSTFNWIKYFYISFYFPTVSFLITWPKIFDSVSLYTENLTGNWLILVYVTWLPRLYLKKLGLCYGKLDLLLKTTYVQDLAGGKVIRGDFYWIIFHNENTCYQKTTKWKNPDTLTVFYNY